jgi:aminoglycoside 6'-N-acetyltransferase
MGVPGKPSLRRATRKDVELLVAWHADPDVSRYWDGKRFTPEEVEARLARDRVDGWILEEDRAPVGFLQSWWEEDEPRRGGLDGFLIPSARGRRIMPTLARRLAQRLLAEGWVDVTVDPYAWNERAIRGWANAGFVEESRHPADEEHTAEWVLMRFRQVPGTGTVPGT